MTQNQSLQHQTRFSSAGLQVPNLKTATSIGLFRFLRLCLGLSLVASTPAMASAVYTYSYTGGPYDGDTNGAFVQTPPLNVSGSFTSSVPLPANSSIDLLANGTLVSFTFNNGLETISNTNGVVYVFVINTDGQGQVSSTGIQVQQWVTSPSVGGHLNDIEIIDAGGLNHRSYQDVTCTQVNGSLCEGINYVSGQSSYAKWSIGVWQAPLSVAPETNPIEVNGSTNLTALGGTGAGLVSFALTSGPCRLTGAVLTGTGTGTCEVIAIKAQSGPNPQETSQPAAVTVNPASQLPLQVIPNPQSIPVGGTSTLSVSGGSGTGAVTYALLGGPCSLNGSTLTGTGAGGCAVTATKAGDNSYNSETSPPSIVDVMRVPQSNCTLILNPTTVQPGQSVRLSTSGCPSTGTTTYSAIAIPQNTARSSPTDPSGTRALPAPTALTCPISGTVLTPTGGYGVCLITASVEGDSTYDAATVSGSVSVTPPPAPIPSLSDSAKAILTLWMLGLLAWARRRNN